MAHMGKDYYSKGKGSESKKSGNAARRKIRGYGSKDRNKDPGGGKGSKKSMGGY